MKDNLYIKTQFEIHLRFPSIWTHKTFTRSFPDFQRKVANLLGYCNYFAILWRRIVKLTFYTDYFQ